MHAEAESQPPSLDQNNDAPQQQSSAINIDNSPVGVAAGINYGAITTNNNTTNIFYTAEKKLLVKSPPRVWLPTNKSELCQYFEIELKLRGIVTNSEYTTDYDYYAVWFNHIEPDAVDQSILPWIQNNIAQQKAIFTENPAAIHPAYQYICKSLVNSDHVKSIDSKHTAQAHARIIAKQLIATKFQSNSDPIVLEFQSEQRAIAKIEADLVLDWRDYQQHINATTDTWQRGQEALYDLREWIGASHPLTLNTQNLGYFPALMFGTTFYSATAYRLKVINFFNNQQSEWELSLNEISATDLEYSFYISDTNSKNCILNICTVRTQNSDKVTKAMDNYTNKHIDDLGCVVKIQPKAKKITITDSKDASAIVNFIIDIVDMLPESYQTHQLLISAPVALMVLLGQCLNGRQSWFFHEHIKALDSYQLIDFPIIAQATPNRSISQDAR